MIRKTHLCCLLLLAAPAMTMAAELATLTWNRAGRDLVARQSLDPVFSSRTYALLSVAQDTALTLTRGFGPRLGNERQVVAGASFEVLAGLFPSEAATLAQVGVPRTPAVLFGRVIGRLVLLRAASDGSDAVWHGTVPTGPGIWYSSSGQPPVRPLWGRVRPWYMASGRQFRPAPPPAFGSPAFDAALAEVRQISDTRTPEQLAIAFAWADHGGTFAPAGRFNLIAAEAIAAHDLDERGAARVLSVLNRAMMDAGIAVWDAKYTYWLLRPSQADAAITTPIGLPNFPAYPSGHSGFSGAAAVVLSHFFPDQADTFAHDDDLNSISRLYGGVHYRFDMTASHDMGVAIGELAIQALLAPVASN